MYYEEMLIEGIMHYRTSPDSDFIPYTLPQLSLRYASTRSELSDAQLRMLESKKRESI